MRRREFLSLVGATTVAWPLAALAQQPERRVAVLMNFPLDDPEGQARLSAFVEELRQLGWTDGRNVKIEVRWPVSDAERSRSAEELIAAGGDRAAGRLPEDIRDALMVRIEALSPDAQAVLRVAAVAGARVRHALLDAAAPLDRDTLLAHQQQWVTEPIPTTAALDLLAPAEQDLYRALGAGVFGPAVRLEQERISFAAIAQAQTGYLTYRSPPIRMESQPPI